MAKNLRLILWQLFSSALIAVLKPVNGVENALPAELGAL
jgi:hypothetical protein